MNTNVIEEARRTLELVAQAFLDVCQHQSATLGFDGRIKESLDKLIISTGDARARRPASRRTL